MESKPTVTLEHNTYLGGEFYLVTKIDGAVTIATPHSKHGDRVVAGQEIDEKTAELIAKSCKVITVARKNK